MLWVCKGGAQAGPGGCFLGSLESESPPDTVGMQHPETLGTYACTSPKSKLSHKVKIDSSPTFLMQVLSFYLLTLPIIPSHGLPHSLKESGQWKGPWIPPALVSVVRAPGEGVHSA